MRRSDMDIRQRIIRLIEKQMADFDPAYSLAEQLDSLQLFTLMSFIEEEFGIHFLALELRNENISELDKLTALVASKLK
jgi:acyl carrier protein